MRNQTYMTYSGDSWQEAEHNLDNEAGSAIAAISPRDAANAAAIEWCEDGADECTMGLCVIVVDEDGWQTRWQVNAAREWRTAAWEVKS